MEDSLSSFQMWAQRQVLGNRCLFLFSESLPNWASWFFASPSIACGEPLEIRKWLREPIFLPTWSESLLMSWAELLCYLVCFFFFSWASQTVAMSLSEAFLWILFFIDYNWSLGNGWEKATVDILAIINHVRFSCIIFTWLIDSL